MKRRPDAIRLLLFAVASLTGCTGWRTTPLTPAETLPPRRQAQLFLRDGRRLEWQALRVTTDSVSGVRYVDRPDCDSCRASVAQAEVDSVRLGDRETTGLLIGAAPFAALFAAALVWQISGGGD